MGCHVSLCVLVVSALGHVAPERPASPSGQSYSSTAAAVDTSKRAAFCFTGHLRAAASDPERLLVKPLREVVLSRFYEAGYAVDIFAVTDAGEECQRVGEALGPLQLRSLRCLAADEGKGERRQAEKRWLRRGPRTVWSREAFLGQMKKVRECDDLLEEAGDTYDLVARSRMDVHWHRFPQDVRSLEAPGIVWLPWRSTESISQYMNDLFAIGSRHDMTPYLRVYDAVLDRGNWKLHRTFEASSNGLDTEEVWEVTLLKSGILARQHRGICFNMLSKSAEAEQIEVEDNCPMPLGSERAHPNGYTLDASWSAMPLRTLPGQFLFDPLLTVRLLHLWFAEWARLGRPMKVLDLGCGRGTMIERWLQSHPASIVGVDKLPGLHGVLGDDLLELDLARPIFPNRISRTRGCRFLEPDGASRVVRAAVRHGIPAEEAYTWIVACCYHRDCIGLRLSEGLTFASASDEPPWDPDIELLARRNFSQRGQVPWAAGRADWAVLVDVADHLPESALEVLWSNVGKLAAEGVVISSERKLLQKLSLRGRHPLESLGFVRDRRAESLLQPYALLRGVRATHGLEVFRRAAEGSATAAADAGVGDLWQFKAPQLCTLRLLHEGAANRCRFGRTFGCSDHENIWVTDGCSGWFSRGSQEAACLSDAGADVTRSKWSYAPSVSWQFVECFLPEGPPAEAGAEALELCPTRASSTPQSDRQAQAMAVPLYELGEGHWQSQVIPTFDDPQLALRTNFDAVIHIRGAQAFHGWSRPVKSSAGQCLTWNVWPADGSLVLFEVWNASLADHSRWMSQDHADEDVTMYPLAWVVAEAAVRALDVHERGLTGLYDRTDTFSEWGNNSEIWQYIGLHTVDASENFAMALRQMDGFAAFAGAVRVAAGIVSGQPSPAEAKAAILAALADVDLGWTLKGQEVLAVAEGQPGGPSRALGAQEDPLILGRDSLGRLRMQFRDSFLGRYLYHLSTLA